VVERDLAKVDVAGSTPVSRSRCTHIVRNALPRTPRLLLFEIFLQS
jgi:hypothetical protein